MGTAIDQGGAARSLGERVLELKRSLSHGEQIVLLLLFRSAHATLTANPAGSEIGGIDLGIDLHSLPWSQLLQPPAPPGEPVIPSKLDEHTA